MKIRKLAAWMSLLCLLLLPLATAFGAQQRVYDQGALFTASQREGLEAAIVAFQEQTGMDFVILTSARAHEGISSQAIADDFYDENGFGLDEENSGVLYYIDMYERNQHLSTTGAMIDYMTDARIQSAIDASTSRLSSGNYSLAAETMIRSVTSFVDQGIPDGQYRYDILTGQRLTARHRALTMTHILISAVAAIIAGLVFTITVTRRYQLKGSTYRYAYSANCDLTMTDTNDTFLRTTTRRMPKPPPSDNNGGFGNGGGGGGSGVHVGSSGTSHGGGGGRF